MSFGTQARKVRDPSLPYGRRVQALGSCVQLYRPIGFNATWTYLGSQVLGAYRGDPRVLVGYLDVIERSRSIRLVKDAEYAAQRRQEKAWFDSRLRAKLWHGDEAAGAQAALQTWRRRMRPQGPFPADPELVALLTLVDANLEAPAPHTLAHRQEVRDCIARLRRREREVDVDRTRTWVLREMAWHLTIAIDGSDADVDGPRA